VSYMAMNDYALASKGRIRTPVGHKYIDALQAKVDGHSPSHSIASRSSSTDKQAGLDLLILGVTSGTAIDAIDFALCRFTQETPEAPLYLDLIQVLNMCPTRYFSHAFLLRSSNL